LENGVPKTSPRTRRPQSTNPSDTPQDSKKPKETEEILNDLATNGKNAKLSKTRPYLEAVKEIRDRLKIDATSLEEAALSEVTLKPFGGLNVLSAYIDYMIDDKGKETDELGVRILLAEMPHEIMPGISPGVKFPEFTSNGIPVCLFESGPLEEQLSPGDGIWDGVMFGTIGAIVTQRGSVNPQNGQDFQFLLSNRHVLARESDPPVGKAVFARGTRNIIGQLTHWSPQRDAFVDHALAVIVNNKVTPPNKGFILNPQPILRDELRQLKQQGQVRVKKFGAASELTFGVIDRIGVSIGIGGRTRHDQLTIAGTDPTFRRNRRFSDEGDSGSLVVEFNTNRPVGLLLAGAGSLSAANILDNTISDLNIKSFVG